MEHIDQFLANYGYFALFGLLMLGIVGPLIPDETILVLAGIAVHRGQMQPVATVLVAFAGSLCGITLSYILGRTGAYSILRRIPPMARSMNRHLPQVHAWFEHFGKWTLSFGYFIVGVRHFTAVVAGLSGLRPATFALYAYPGALVWVTCFITIGYYLGHGWQAYAHRLGQAALIAAILIAAGALAAWWWSRKKST